MFKHLLPLGLSCICLLGLGGWTTGAAAEEKESSGSIVPAFTLTLLNPKDEYEVGEQWLCEFEAKVTAPENRPVTIRAWSRFFGEYEALAEVYGPVDEIQLSDVLALGLQIGREEGTTVRWNVPNAEIFKKASKTIVPAGQSKS